MRYPGEDDGLGADEQRLADLLKQIVPEPPRQLTYEEITVRNVERTAKSWLIPALAAACVLIIGGAVGAVAATRPSPPHPVAAAAQGTSRASGPAATPSAQPTPPNCQPIPEPTAKIRQGTVIVPYVTGLSLVAAESVLERAGVIVVTERDASGASASIVLAQSPAARSRVPRGAVVAITIAAKSGAVPTPTPLPTSGCPTPVPSAAEPTPVPSGAVPTPGGAVPTPLPSTGVPTSGTAVPTAGGAVPTPRSTGGAGGGLTTEPTVGSATATPTATTRSAR